MSTTEIPQEIKTDDKLINHIRNVKLLQAIYSGKKFFIECLPTDEGAKCFPNSNFAVKEIELPNFDLYEEKLGYKWTNSLPQQERDELKSEMQMKVDYYEDKIETQIRIAAEKNNEIQSLISERDELRKEVEQLRAWKQEALSVMPDYQAIGKALNIRLGESIHDKILPEIDRLKGLIETAYNAGFNRGSHEENNYGNAFDYLLADKSTPTWQQFKQKNKL